MKKKKLINLLSSPYLAAVLFVFLAIIVFISTYIPQESSVGSGSLIDRFGLENYKLIKSLGLNDAFHSSWYIFLLFILSFNLTIASFYKVFPRSRKAFRWASFLKINKNYKNQIQKPLNEWTDFQKKLKKNFWEIRLNSENNSLIARKGAFHRLGPSITHIGILIIMLGAFISLLFGFNGIIKGFESDRFIITEKLDAKRSYILVEQAKIFHSDYWLGESPNFEVEIDKTERFNYANNQPKQWKTDLSFYSTDGILLNSQKMEVNKPISFKNVDFYQADWKRVLKIIFNKQNFEINLDQVGQKEMAFISINKDLGLLFLISPKDQTLNLISVTGNLNNSILQNPQNLLKNGHLKLLASNLKPNDKAQIGPMQFQFIGAFSQTGIQFKHSPGDLLMIIGMCILLIGVFIAFGSKRFIWAVKNESENTFFIIAKSDRLPQSFSQELYKLT